MKKVLGIGNALVDIISFIPDDSLLDQLSLPKGSMQLVDSDMSAKVRERISGHKMHYASGGSAANTINGLAALGVQTGFIGTIGSDDMGIFFKKDMEESGIETFLLNGGQPTGLAISLVSKDGERTFATFLGSAVEIASTNLNSSVFKMFDLLHIEGYLVQNHSLMNKALTIAKQHNMTISIDLASYNVVQENHSYLHDIVSQYIDIVFANESEAHAFTSVENPETALKRMSTMCKTAIVKTGEKGSLIMQDGTLYRINATDANCLDTTGAGDLYAAGFLYGVVKGLSPEICGKTGALLAGKVIEEPGARMGKNAWDYIHKQLKHHV